MYHRQRTHAIGDSIGYTPNRASRRSLKPIHRYYLNPAYLTLTHNRPNHSTLHRFPCIFDMWFFVCTLHTYMSPARTPHFPFILHGEFHSHGNSVQLCRLPTRILVVASENLHRATPCRRRVNCFPRLRGIDPDRSRAMNTSYDGCR